MQQQHVSHPATWPFIMLQGMFAFPYLACVCRANIILFLKCGRLPAYHDVPEWQPHRLKD